MAVNLYEHQKKAVDKLSSGSILCGGVGTGKSRTALAYFYTKVCGGKIGRTNGVCSDISTKKALYIITTARKRDTQEWDEELAHFCLSQDVSLSKVPVHVDSWNNIKKYVDVSGAFFIFDEQRLVGSGAWVKAFLKIAKTNDWILLTATPGDCWLDYAPVFIANGFYRNITEFRARHVVYHRYAKFPKVERYVDEAKLEKLRTAIVVNMDFQKEATRHHSYIQTDYDKNLYDRIAKDRWDVFKDQPFQNKAEICYALRRVVNGDSHRAKAVANILENHPKCIVFYNFDYELELLRKFCRACHISYAEWNGHKHEEIPSTASWLYLVQYTAGSEGWNCVETDTVIFFSQTYSYKTLEQACGRIDRMNTPFTDLYYFHIFSGSGIDRAIHACLKKKKNFNEKTWSLT